MSKQSKNKNRAHLFENAGAISTTTNSPNIGGVTSIATGGLTLADSIYTPFRDINNADVQLVKPTNVGQINDLDTLQTFRIQLEPQQISYSDVGGHSKSQSWANIGKGAGAGASVGAGIGSFVGPIGTVIGAGVGGILGGGISAISEAVGGKRAKQKQKEEQELANENYNTQLAMLDNQAYNINANQLAEKQFGYINALGGNLHSNSTTWSNGLNYIGSGGSHESNPNDGVAISTAPDGLQNKVEEGEVVWNDDYVFSKRLKVPKKDLEKNKWKGETYADIAKKLMDESAERPNDPITLRGLDDSLSRLRDSQDELKAKQKGNKIKKEIASIPPELLAQMQQAQQQPTEEEIMQQQAMEQMPQEQMPMVDPSMQQPTMEQPPMYAKGGPLKGGPGKFIHLSDESKYDYAVNKKPIAAIFDDIFQKNKNKRQPLIYKKEHVDPEDQNVIKEEIDYSLDNLNKEYNQSRYIGFDEQEDIEKNKFAKGGHLFPDGGEYEQWLDLVNRANNRTAFETSSWQPLTRDAWSDSNLVKNNPMPNASTIANDRMGQNSAFRLRDTQTRDPRLKLNAFDWDGTTLRYAPVWGSIFNLARSIASRPDYGNPERIERAAARVGAQVSPKYIGDYLRYKPLDEAYYLNQLNAQQNAANNAIVGLSNGNRSMALASMLANDYNYNNQRGAAYRQGLEYNEAQRQRAAEFNRGTNQFNAQQYMQAAAQNASNRAQAANLISAAAQMREGIDNAYGASQSANWTNLFNNLGAVGKDRMNWNMAKDIYDYQTGRNGEVKYKPAAKGGYLTIKTNNRRKE